MKIMVSPNVLVDRLALLGDFVMVAWDPDQLGARAKRARTLMRRDLLEQSMPCAEAVRKRLLGLAGRIRAYGERIEQLEAELGADCLMTAYDQIAMAQLVEMICQDDATFQAVYRTLSANRDLDRALASGKAGRA